MSDHSGYEALVHAAAGGCGAAVAMTVFYPLETVRTRLQLEDTAVVKKRRTVLAMVRAIYRREGLPGLYKGIVPVLQSLYVSQFVYFYAFHGLRRVWHPHNTAVSDLLVGMAAGAVNVLATCPLWVVNTRIKVSAGTAHAGNTSLVSGLLDVYRVEGVTGLWSGCGSSLMLVINPALQFMMYEALRRIMTPPHGAPHALQVFICGALSKVAASTLTYPLQLGQARQRLDSTRTVFSLLRQALQNDGVRGVFRGLSAKLLQTVLTAALMFLCYEKIIAFVFILMTGREN